MTKAYHLHGEVPLTPAELVDYLWQRHRTRRSERTLRLYRWKGGGPPFFRIGNDVRYLPSLVDDWAVAERGEPLRNNSQRSARQLMASAKDESA